MSLAQFQLALMPTSETHDSIQIRHMGKMYQYQYYFYTSISKRQHFHGLLSIAKCAKERIKKILITRFICHCLMVCIHCVLFICTVSLCFCVAVCVSVCFRFFIPAQTGKSNCMLEPPTVNWLRLLVTLYK